MMQKGRFSECSGVFC